MTKPLRLALYFGAGLAGLVLLLVLVALLVLPSRWFENQVRLTIVNEIERASGGRAEIGTFHFDWKALTARVSPFVLHGTEPPQEAPLLRAASVEVGLRVISIFHRDIHISSLHVDGPEINVLVDKNGITNFPTPKISRTSVTDPVQQVLDLSVRDFQIKGGSVRYIDRKIPIELEGRNLDAHLAFDFGGPRYTGTLKFEQLRLDTAETNPLTVAFESEIKLERNRLGITSARLGMRHSNVALSGEIVDFKEPKATLKVNAVGDLAELGVPLNLPRPHVGTVRFTGTATYTSGKSYQLAGKISGNGLGVDEAAVHLRNVSLDSDVQLNSDQLLLRGVVLKAVDGSFTGAASLTGDFTTLKLNGTVNGISARSLAAAEGIAKVPWNGRLSGPVEVTARLAKRLSDVKAAGTMDIAPVDGEPPLAGKIEFAYDQRNGVLALGRSYLQTPGSRVSFNGTLGQQLQVEAETRDLSEVQPLVGRDLPLRLNPGGTARFAGTVTGSIQNGQVAGSLRLDKAILQGEPVDSFVAQVEADPSRIHLTSVAAGQGQTKLQGSVDVALQNWRVSDTGSVDGTVHVQNVSIANLLNKAGRHMPVDGTLSADIVLTGAAMNPHANVRVVVREPVIYGERFDRFTGEVRYTGEGVEVINARLELGTARLYVAGTYAHRMNDWLNGSLRFDSRSEGFTLAQFQHIHELRPGIRGQFNVTANGQADVRKGEVLLTTLTGEIATRNLAVNDQAIGDLIVDAKTAGQQLRFTAKGNLRGSEVKGEGTFQLTGDYPGRGELTFSPMTLTVVQDLVRTARGGTFERLPFDGVVEGHVTFSGPARNPDLMIARVEFPTLQVVPARRSVQTRAVQRDLSLRNQGSVVAELDGSGLHVRNARFIGPDTDLSVTGTLNHKARSPWDLRVDGNVNLALLEDFNSDIVASGIAGMAATIRGTMENPQLTGRLELKDASFYMTDFPNGLDQTNGTVVFDTSRATIERLTAVTGGGKLTLSGFVGFGGGTMLYRLQARADGVRIRYPEGVSLAANAALNLNGTSSRSLLSGVVTVLRAGFNPRTDVGGLLAASATPIQTPTTPNETLRNLSLDVRVETVPNLTFQTNLTQDLQAEADLRIRGTAAKPAVLGRVTITQGEIQFFGNKYTINRGEIGFYNPVRIEPVLDMDLETKVRAITVNINFAGPINKLNVAYRSDPPLQSNEIVALLAVGRTPGATTGLAASQTTTNQGIALSGTNTLLGQAVAAPVSSRLQRFFGVSRLKIDPTLTNLDAIPQARLTLEQQISRDVTLTYITNLSNTNQQIVRVEWDVNRNWSVVAVREENGLFGIDFLYKKRVK